MSKPRNAQECASVTENVSEDQNLDYSAFTLDGN